MKSSFTSHSPKETKDFARDFAKQILFNPAQKKGALIIGLEGELGAGKTTFVQGFAKGLGIRAKVLSPTFVILKFYKLQTKNYKLFYHIDCYRLQNSKELLALGWEKVISDPRSIVLIEWADRVKKILPKDTLWISFSRAKRGLTKRIIVVQWYNRGGNSYLLQGGYHGKQAWHILLSFLLDPDSLRRIFRGFAWIPPQYRCLAHDRRTRHVRGSAFRGVGGSTDVGCSAPVRHD